MHEKGVWKRERERERETGKKLACSTCISAEVEKIILELHAFEAEKTRTTKRRFQKNNLQRTRQRNATRGSHWLMSKWQHRRRREACRWDRHRCIRGCTLGWRQRRQQGREQQRRAFWDLAAWGCDWLSRFFKNESLFKNSNYNPQRFFSKISEIFVFWFSNGWRKTFFACRKDIFWVSRRKNN